MHRLNEPQRALVDVLADVRGAPIAIDELTRAQALERRPEWMPEPVLESLLDVEAASVGMPATVTIPRPIGHDGVTYSGTYAG